MKRNRTMATRAILALAATTAAPATALAAATNDPGYNPINGQEFYVSTSGATALGAFTRANNGSPTSQPPMGTYTRSTFSLGQSSLRIGRTVYTRVGAQGQFFAIENLNDPPDPAEPGLNNDRIVYDYLERGSINGLNDLINSNGLRIGSYPTPTPPLPTANQPLWRNGNYLAGSGSTNGGYSYPPAQGPVKIAWSDVRFQQGLSIPGTGTYVPQAVPGGFGAGYGLGRGSIGGANFQQFASANTVKGNGTGATAGVDAATTYLRNESLAIVGFNMVANPGTGLTRLTKEEGKWLQATGRLPNGANFNSVTRDVGSGTRNQGALNFGLDPSWASGERDRISLAPTYNDLDPNGNSVTITQGVSEANPERSILTGSLTPDLNERRISPVVRFADKTGGSIVREVVVQSRMGLGILSAGDSRSSSGGTALSSNTNVPLRALAIDFANGWGYNQAKAYNITEGMYELWSAAQAITVSGSIGGSGTYLPAASNPISIYQDQDDEAALGTLSSQTGVARKFLSNITGSIATDIGAAETVRTPAEALIQAGYILPQIMKYERGFDGRAATLRNNGTGRSTTSPPPPALTEQQLWDVTIGSGTHGLATSNNWVDPATQWGNIAGGNVRYNIYAKSNTLSSGSSNADVTITINERNKLIGDMDGDGVRDLGDTEELALAYANPQAYAATQTGTLSISTGTFATRSGGLVVVPGANVTEQRQNTNLVVLTDFNSNGNIPLADGTVTLTVVERADVKYFLYGCAIDTSAYNTPAVYTLNQASDPLGGSGTVSLTALQNRRENGVRLGQLKKNAAIVAFNNTLQGFEGNLTNPATGLPYTQSEINALKFNRFDVNFDGAANLADAKVVDRNVGKNYTNLNHVLGTTDDLIAAELTDNNLITHVDPDGAGPLKSDFQVLREELGLSLFDGDADLNGMVDISDLGILATNWQQTVDQWSDADFDFNGMVDISDLGMLATNWQAGSSGPTVDLGSALASLGLPGSVVPEPAGLAALLPGLAMLMRRRR